LDANEGERTSYAHDEKRVYIPDNGEWRRQDNESLLRENRIIFVNPDAKDTLGRGTRI